MLVHIMQSLNLSQFYGKSTFNQEHDHKREFIELIIRCYMDVKSTETCKVITRLSQLTKKRHEYLKELHRLGQ